MFLKPAGFFFYNVRKKIVEMLKWNKLSRESGHLTVRIPIWLLHYLSHRNKKCQRHSPPGEQLQCQRLLIITDKRLKSCTFPLNDFLRR